MLASSANFSFTKPCFWRNEKTRRNSFESAALNSLFSAAWCSNNTQHDTFSGRGSLFTLSSTSPDNLHDSSRDIYWPFLLLLVALRPASSLSSCCVAIWPLWRFIWFGKWKCFFFDPDFGGRWVWETTTTANWCRWMGFGRETQPMMMMNEFYERWRPLLIIGSLADEWNGTGVFIIVAIWGACWLARSAQSAVHH